MIRQTLALRLFTAAMAIAGALAAQTAPPADPFTITAPLAGNALSSCGDLSLSGQATVDSAGLTAPGTGNAGNVVSNGNITVTGNAVVNGNATAGPGNSVKATGNAKVTGTSATATSAYGCNPIDLVALTNTLRTANDNAKIPLSAKGKNPLASGNHTDFALDGKDSITLPAGTYFFTSFKVTGGSVVTLGGTARILCTGPVSINGGSSVNDTPNPFALRFWGSGSTFTLDNGTIAAFVYFPAGAASINTARLSGGLFANGISVSGQSHVTRSIDDVKPRVTITSPANNSVLTDPAHVVVTGTVFDDQTAVTLKVNGQPAVINPDGSYSVTLNLTGVTSPATISAVATDVAGNTALVSVSVITMKPPKITLTSPADGSWVNTRLVTLTGNADNAATVTVNGTPATIASGVWTLSSYDLGADGAHTLNIIGSNAGGSTPLSATINSDTVAPSIALTINGQPVTDGQIYSAAANISAVVTDMSKTTTAVTLDGATITLPTSTAAEKVHQLSITATDQANNITPLTRSFTVDLTPPVITILANGQPLTSGATFRTAPVITYSATDLTLDKVTATLNGAPFASGDPIANEGEYTIAVSATDKAGHSSNSSAMFVFRSSAPGVQLLANGSAFQSGLATKTDVTFTLVVSDPTPTTAVMKIDAGTPGEQDVNLTDATYANGVVVSTEAHHTVSVVVTNAGNISSAPIGGPFTIDRTAPTVSITESGQPFQDNAIYNHAINPVVVAADNLAASPTIVLTVDGNPYPLNTPIANESATHTIAATATDDAGNASSTATYHFIIDMTPPKVAILDAQTGKPFAPDALYNKPVGVQVSVTDITTPTLALSVDGNSVAVGSPVRQSDGSWLFSATISGDGLRTVSAVATDVAGNKNDPVSAQFTIDTTPPAIVFTAPQDKSSVGTPAIVVQGTCDDAQRVVVNGVDAAVDTNAKTFAANLVLLEGKNTINAYGIDKAGNRGDAAPISVVLDTTPPTLTVDSPHPNDCVDATQVTVSGSVADLSAVTVNVVSGANTLQATVGSDNKWSAVVPAPAEGPLPITVTATDALGHATTVAVPVTIDRTAPTVTITEGGTPFTATMLNRSVALFARAADANPVAVNVTLDQQPYVQGSLISTEGTHTVTATASDCANHTITATATFTIDLTPPAITNVQPENGKTINNKRPITGNVPPDAVSVAIDGTAVTTTPANGSFSLNAPWVEGTNHFVLVATDAAGNRSQLDYTVTIKTTVPTLTILESGAPMPDGKIYNRAVTPVVTSSDPVHAKPQVTLNDAAFTSGTAVTGQGSYTLKATATDDAGNAAAAVTRTFTIDTTAPNVTIMSPQNGASVSTDRVDVQVTTTSTDVAGVTVNGTAAVLQNGAYVVTGLPLEIGPNTIVATAFDRAGNSASATVDVTRGRDALGIIITEPNTATTNRKTIAVAGQILTPVTGATLTINGASVPFDAQGLFRKTDFAVTEADNAIVATVSAPNIASNSATVHILGDFTPPQLKLTANGQDLTDGARFATAPTLAVSATDKNPGVTTAVTVDGASVADLSTLSLANGGHAMTAIATDVAGNQARIDRTFVIGSAQTSTDCALSGFNPADGAVVATDTITLTGNCGGGGGVLVNTVPAQILDGTFSATGVKLPLAGANSIVIACAANGTPSGDSKTITLYRYPIADITITSPHDLDVVTTGTVTVSGTVADGVVSGNVNGAAFTPQNHAFTVNGVVLASEGLNVIEATAVNSSGRSAATSVRVKRLTNAPQIGISSPLPGTQTGAATVDVSGSYMNADGNTLMLTVGGTQTPITPTPLTDTNGTFVVPNVPLSAGVTTTITVSCRNAAGAQATASVDVKNVASAPAVSISAPLDNSFIPATQTSVAVSGKVVLPANVTTASVSVNGVNATVDGSANFTATLDLSGIAPGTVPIVARATTPDGNTGTDAVRVTRFSGPLSVTQSFPSPNAVSIDPGVAVIVVFSNLLNSSSVAPAFHLTGAGATITGRTFVDRDTVTFAPDAPLTQGVTYTLTIDTTVKDAAGSSMASPYSFSFSVASASASPNAPTLTTTDKSGCVTSDTIAGKASAAGVTVQLSLDGTSRTTTAAADASFSFAVNFATPGFHVARVCEVATDGTKSPEADVNYQVDCNGPQVSSAVLDRAAKTVSITFSRAMNASTLTASATGTIRIQLDGGTPLDGVVTANGNTFVVAFTADASTATVQLTVSKSVQDTNGVSMSADYVQTFMPDALGGYVSGAVYDASTGRPLANANIDVQVPATATGGRLAANARRLKSVAMSTPLVTDTRGRYFAPLSESVYTLQASAVGYTNAWRQVVVNAGVGVIPIDIRLARRAPAQTMGSAALSITQSGQAGITTDVALTIPGGALTSGQTVSLTPLGAQSLPGLLPLGWSPAAAAEIAIASSPLPQPIAGSSVSFHLGSGAAAAIASAAKTLSLVEYASDRDEWRVVVNAVNVGSDGTVNVPVDNSGYFALVFPDTVTPPPAPHTGAALAAIATNPCANSTTNCTITSTGFGFQPNPVSASGHSVATLTVDGKSSQFPSGTAVQAFIDEELDLADGRVVTDPPFATDLLLYRDVSGATGVAAFNLAPTSQAQSYTLRDGADHVRIVEYPGRVDRGALIGSAGGRVPGDDSVTIDIPSGATDQPLHASVASIPANQLPSATIAGFHVVGGFTFSLTWENTNIATAPALLKPARATFSVPAGNSEIIVAEVLSSTPYGTMYRLASRTAALQTVAAPGTRVLQTTTETTLLVDGIVRDGRYLLLSADQPIAYAFGHVIFGGGGPSVPQAKVTSGIGNPLASPLGVADVTRTNGNFAVPIAAAPAAPFGVLPSSIATGDGTPLVPGDSPAADVLRDLGAVPLAGTPPQVTTYTPNGEVNAYDVQISATFSSALDPTSISDSSVIVNNLTTGATLSGHVALNAGTVLVFTPAATLPAGSTFSVTVASSVKGTNGTRLAAPFIWQFTTKAVPTAGGPVNVDPTTIRITIPDANGVSTVSGGANALPANAIAIAVRRGVAFIHQYQTTITSGQPFSFAIGGLDPADHVTLDDDIDLQVVDGATGGIIAIVPLMPFVTPDGTGFAARPNVTTSYTNAGITITVPAGAFDKTTIVTATKGASSDFAAVPTFTDDLAWAAGVNVSFDGTPTQRLEVQITPDTPGNASTPYVLGVIGKSSRGPRVEIVDLITWDGSKYTTTPSTSSSGTKLRLTTNEVLTGPAARNLLLGIDRPGSYGVASFFQAPAWVITTALQGLDLFPSTYPSIYTSARYMAERGRVLMPAKPNLPFDIIAVDAQSGITVATATYTAIAPGDPSAAAAVPSPIDNNLGPYPTFGMPMRVEILDLTSDDFTDRSHAGIQAAYHSGTLTLTNDSTYPMPDNTHVEAVDLNTSDVYATDDFKTDGIAPFAADRGDRIILLVGAKDVDPSSTIAISFNRAINPAHITSSNFKLMMADIPPSGGQPNWQDVSATTTVQAASGSDNRVVNVSLPAAMQLGKLFRVVINKNVSEVPPLPPSPGAPAPTPLTIGQRRGQSTGLSDDLHLDFSTRAPAGEITNFQIPQGTVRDLAMNGNILLVSALQAGVFAYDASDPGSLTGQPTPMATIAVPGPTDQVPAGEDWALSTDDHDRVWATALTSTFGVMRSYRIEDVISGPSPVQEKATAIVSWRVGVDVGLPLSTDALTISDRPEAIPRRMRIVNQDTTAAPYPSMQALAGAYNGSSLVDIGGGFFKTTLQIPGNHQNPYMLQRVTVTNATRSLSWSVDAGRLSGGQLTVLGQPTDSFEVRANENTYGVVSLFGYGVGIFDLNAIDSNRVQPSDPKFDPSYVPVTERLLMTPGGTAQSCNRDMNTDPGVPVCDAGAMANAGQHCPIPDLTFSPEAALAATKANTAQPNPQPAQLVVYGLEQNHGIIELRITPPQPGVNGGTPLNATCNRANDLVLMERVPHNGTTRWFGHPRLNKLRNIFNGLTGRDPVGRYATISTFTTPVVGGQSTMYALVSAFEYGVLVLKLDPSGGLTNASLVDDVWVPAGALAVRVLNGQNVASVIDGKGRILLIDITKIDESGKVNPSPTPQTCTDFDNCVWDLFPSAAGAIQGTPAYADEVGTDDPRIIWKSKWDPNSPVPVGTLAPLVDPDSGFVYSADPTQNKVHVNSAIDPRVRFMVNTGSSDGQLKETKTIVPLGVDPGQNAGLTAPNGSLAVFRLQLSLPGSITNSLPNQQLSVAVESETVPGSAAPQSPAGYPRSSLRLRDAHGNDDPRPATTFTMVRLAPVSTDPAAAKIRYQRGYNLWASPWVIAISDLRACRAFLWGSTNPASAGCNACTAPAYAAQLAEPYAFELLTSGRYLAARPEVCGQNTPNCSTQGSSIFTGTYAYLGASNRLVSRVATYPTDTYRPQGVAIAGQNPPVVGGAVQETTYAHSGELGVHVVDLVVGGESRLGFTVDRSYLSRTVGGTPFGIGWSSSLFERIRILPSGDVEYRDAQGEIWRFAKNGNDYDTPKGLFIKLSKDATTGLFQLQDQQFRYTFFDGIGRIVARSDSFANPLTVAFGGTDGNVVRYLYDSRGHLANILDGAGRTTIVTYWDGGDNADGHYTGYIKKITDWRNREVEYHYDTSGRLTTVLLPMLQAGTDVPSNYAYTADTTRPRITYAYQSVAGAPNPLPITGVQAYNDAIELGGDLTSITDPAEFNAAAGGTPVARVSFDYDTTTGPLRDKVLDQNWGTHEHVTFNYLVSGQTTVTDALGQQTTYMLASQGDNCMHVTSIQATNVPTVSFDSGDLPTNAPISTSLAQAATLNTGFEYGSLGEISRVTYPNGRVDQFTNLPAPNNLPGTVLDNIGEQGGTGLTTKVTYDTRSSAPANPMSIARGDASTAPTDREAQQASRVRLKTFRFDNDGSTPVGYETLRDKQGRVRTSQVINVQPSDNDQLASAANVLSLQTFDYASDTLADPYTRGRLITETDSATPQSAGSGDVRIEHTYAAGNGGGETETITDTKRGVVTTIDRDAGGHVIHRVVKDSDGDTQTYESFGYDASGRLAFTLRHQGPVTVKTTTEYDAMGRVTKTSMTNGAQVMGAAATLVSSTKYDLPNHTITADDPHVDGATAFAQTVTTTDALGRTLRTLRRPSDTTVPGPTIESDLGYDLLGRVSYETDSVRAAVAHKFDSQGREIGSVTGSGILTLTNWTPWGETDSVEVKDSSGTRIAFTKNRYTSKGRLRGTADEIVPNADARWTWHSWSAGNQSTGTMVGPSTNVTTIPPGTMRGTVTTYDLAGRPKETDTGELAFTGTPTGIGIFAQTLYQDYLGSVAKTMTTNEPLAGKSATTTVDYDALNRVTTATLGGKYTTQTDYDEAGNLTTATPPGLQSETMTYDGRGLMLTDKRQDGNSVTYQYDALGNVRNRVDESGKATTYDVDALGRIVKTTYLDGTTEVTDYEDKTGLVSAVKNRKDEWHAFFYNKHGNLIEVHNVESPTLGNPQTLIESRSYDAAQHLTRIANADAAIEFDHDQYDLLGRPHLTRTIRYKDHSGFAGQPTVVDVYTQVHEWNAFGERTRWRMPFAGAALPTPEPTTPWMTWIDEQHDATGNVTAVAPAPDATSSAGAPFVTSVSRSTGRLFSRSRTTNVSTPLQTVYRYGDANVSGTSSFQPPSGFDPATTPDKTGLRLGAETLRGATGIQDVFVTRDDTAHSPRVFQVQDAIFGRHLSQFRYDSRSRLQNSWLAAAPDKINGTPTTDSVNESGFRFQRQSPARLSASQHASLGQSLSLSLEVPPWTADDTDPHYLHQRTISLDSSPVNTLTYTFEGGRRKTDGTWKTEYDTFSRVTAMENDTLGRRIEYLYDPRGRMIARTAKRSDTPGTWTLETDTTRLQADGLPADTTFVWDPISDRLVSIFAAGTSGGAPIRQYLHGDQSYDDPVRVLIDTAARDGGAPSGTPTAYFPLADETATGSVTAVSDANGVLTERILYGDAYGDAPRYLRGAAVEHVTFEAKKDPNTGLISSVTVKARLTDDIDPTTVAGAHLSAVDASNQVVATYGSNAQLSQSNELTWTLDANDWSSLSTANNAAALQVSVSNSLFATAWGTTPIAPPPDWALQLYAGVSTSAANPFMVRASLIDLQAYIDTGNATPRLLYDIPDLYLAASTESKVKLLTGFKSAPFIDGATGLAYFRARWYDPATGNWLTPDPMGYRDSSDLYAGFAGDPVNNDDPSGLLIDDFGPIDQLLIGKFSEKYATDSHFASNVDAAVDVGGQVLASPSVQGTLQIVGGCGEAAVGAYAIGQTAGLAALPAGVAFFHGIDVCGAGFRTLWTGEVQESLTKQGIRAGIEAFGVSHRNADVAANYAELGISLYGTVGAGRSLLGLSRVATDAATFKPSIRTNLLKPFEPVNLTFGEDDLVYGPYQVSNEYGTYNPTELLQRRAGGKLLSDFEFEKPPTMSWPDFSYSKMENALAHGNKIRFDLTHLNVDQALGAYGPYADSTTSLELRYLQGNWSRFRNNVVFYNRYRVVHPW